MCIQCIAGTSVVINASNVGQLTPTTNVTLPQEGLPRQTPLGGEGAGHTLTRFYSTVRLRQTPNYQADAQLLGRDRTTRQTPND